MYQIGIVAVLSVLLIILTSNDVSTPVSQSQTVHSSTQVASTPQPGYSQIEVVEASGYQYDAPPSISKALFIEVLHANNSPMAPEADAIYDVISSGGIDPVFWLAHTRKEGQYGHQGTARPWAGDPNGGLNNPGGVRGTSSGYQMMVTSYNMGVYESYTMSARDWVWLFTTQGLYIDAGLNTIDTVVPRYAPVSENNTQAYIDQMKQYVDEFRAMERGR